MIYPWLAARAMRAKGIRVGKRVRSVAEVEYVEMMLERWAEPGYGGTFGLGVWERLARACVGRKR